MMTNRNATTIVAIAFWLALATLLSGCDRKTDRKLAEIETILDNAIDSAEIMPAIRSLDSIPVENLGGRRRALHALLTVHSRHKQHRPLGSDSLIFKEAAYFDNSSDTYHRMKWHFYRGVTRLELQDYRGAILDALHASRLSAQLPDTLFMAKSEELLGDIYEATYNVTITIQHRRNAAKYYEAANKHRNSWYIYRDIANDFEYLGQYDRGIAILDSIIDNVPKSDSVLLGYIYSMYAYSYAGYGNIEEAEKALKRSRDYSKETFLVDVDLASVGKIYRLANKPDSVKLYIELCKQDQYYLNNVTDIANQEWLAKHLGDYDKACQLSDSIRFLTNALVRDVLNKQSVLAQSDYYLWQTEEEKRHSSYIATITYLISITSLLIIATIIIIYIRHRRRHYHTLSKKLLEISQFQNEIARLKESLHQLSSVSQESDSAFNRLNELFKTEFDKLDNFTQSLSNFPSKKSTTPFDISLKQLEIQYAYIKSEEFLKKVIAYANATHDNIVSKLSEQIPKIKTKDIFFIALKLSGFSTQSICIILDLSSNNYYTRFHRLRTKIEQSNAIDKDLFIETLTIP